jgi:hypothetical protein
MFRNPVDQYTNNTEYRQALRDFFAMKPDKNNIPTGIDEESYDELLYDANAVQIGMDKIFNDTKCHIEFINLYLRAACSMLSEDLETGLAICLCYDHFYKFANYIRGFYENFENWKSEGLDNPLYKELMNVL